MSVALERTGNGPGKISGQFGKETAMKAFSRRDWVALAGGIALVLAGTVSAQTTLEQIDAAAANVTIPDVKVARDTAEATGTLMNGVNKPEDIAAFSIPGADMKLEISKDWKSEGDASLKVTSVILEGKRRAYFQVANGSTPGLPGSRVEGANPVDWSAGKTLRFDVLNPTDKPIRILLHLKSDDSRYVSPEYPVDKKSAKEIVVDLSKLSEGGCSASNITHANIFVYGAPGTHVTFFDNFRLSPEPPAAAAAPAK